MTYMSLVDQAHEILAAVIQAGDTVIDATVGNGYDTLFLAEAVGDTGKVLGFDVQQQAIENTLKFLQQKNLQHRVNLLLQSHANVVDHIPTERQQPIKAVMFNLGYLPGSDKSVTTHTSSTITALDAVLPHLARGGVVSMMAYRGHSGGAQETQAVLDWSSSLDTAIYTVDITKPPTSSEKSPLLIMIKNRR